MGKYNKNTQRYIPSDTQRYKRFCSVCQRTTYEFGCCGKRTRRLNLQATIRDKVAVKSN